MAEEIQLKKLKKSRASLRAKLTQFTSYISIAKSYDSLSLQHKIELQMRLNAIEDTYSDFDKLQMDIEGVAEDDTKEFAEREQFDTIYFANTALARSLLELPSRSEPGETNVPDADSAVKQEHFRLPEIDPPSFNGNFHHWLEFRDMYISLIHENPRINEISKFHYLRSSLKGSASLVIQSLDFTVSNYQVAWQLLTERYDNQKILINNHIQALFNADLVQKESSKSLRNLIDVTNKNLRALNSLGLPTDHWDILIIYIMAKKLDYLTSRKWEEKKNKLTDQPSLKQFLTFLSNTAELLETLQNNKQIIQKSSYVDTQTYKTKSSSMITENYKDLKQLSCPMCKQQHHLFNCDSFRALDVDSRIKRFSDFNNVCKNCLRIGHQHKNCRLTHCKYCNSKHNTLLHKDIESSNLNNKTITLSAHSSSNQDNINSSDNDRVHVILSTAMVKVMDKNGQLHPARALLDNGSTSNFVTSDLCEKLDLAKHSTSSTIVGINSQVSSSTKSCTITLQSLNGSYKANINCYILPHITTSLPVTLIHRHHIPIPTGIELADPSFNIPATVDLLVGAEIFWQILGTSCINLGKHQPVLRESKLGWIVSGSILSHPYPNASENTLTHCNFTQSLETQVNKFWELDSVSTSHTMSKEEQECESLFIQTTRRDVDGKFIVTLPLKESPEVLGDSYIIAKRRFLSLERKLQNNELMRNDYHNFVREYIHLGHMTQNKHSSHQHSSHQHSSHQHTSRPQSSSIQSSNVDYPNIKPIHSTCNVASSNIHSSITHDTTSNLTSNTYNKCDKIINNYLPHHGVVRETSTTTKLRVVFDASAITSTGKSFNEIQKVGPTVQSDLLSILLRFRQHKYVVTSDVEKMYRAINIEPSQRSLQQIIFRFDPSQPLHTYTLNTVTYGTACAPYLATRCLLALAEQCDNPVTKRAIAQDFYVDDFLSGGESVPSVTDLCRDVIHKLDSAKFNLRKWQSNSPELLQSISEIKGDQDKTLNLSNSTPSKTLGLYWNCNSDNLFFVVDSKSNYNITKRNILSAISQVFDPIGLVGPCIVEAKIILQKLWKLSCEWDDEVPIELKTAYLSLIQSLPLLNSIHIPRWAFNASTVSVEIHTFTDASERAYGACCYVRTITHDSNIRVRLLASKNKIAPIKSSTIPRLELCGALLGTRLHKKIRKSLTIKFDKSYFWTDSTVVLGWLSATPSNLKSFVRNRVNEIHENIDNQSWSYVPSKENPADLVSRGVRADTLSASSLWWTGPSFLHTVHLQFPVNPNKHHSITSLPEMSLFIDTTQNPIIKLINKISDFSKLIRITAYLQRFLNNIKNKNHICKDKNLSFSEIALAKNTIICIAQQEMFPEEYHSLKSGESLSSKNRLLSLSPFIDSDNIIRVGGRLHSSFYTYDVKHPILLCSKHILTKLIFEKQHYTSLHASPLLLLSQIRQQYWPLGGRNLARRVVGSCVRCIRQKAKSTQPIMSDLPSDRLHLEYPFLNTGVDYAGPVMIVNRKGRGSRLIKCYICVFVCFAVKALHLELVSDLTKEGFLSALDRFIARRGKPQKIYCDNGTSFVGAFNHMIRNCSNDSHDKGIQFKFIPAYSPHFGGLWEAAVKSVKFHLIRILGLTHLTFEEMTTCLAQVESILNSRPLTPMSSDPSDLSFLSPAHFLIGRSLTSVPYPDVTEASITSLQRFQRIEQLKQHFWQRYANEYICLLQQRHKWKTSSGQLRVGTMVIIKDKTSPPMMWLLGRIVNLIPGNDGVSRVADIQTSKGVLRRAYNNICPLPITSTGSKGENVEDDSSRPGNVSTPPCDGSEE